MPRKAAKVSDSLTVFSAVFERRQALWWDRTWDTREKAMWFHVSMYWNTVWNDTYIGVLSTGCRFCLLFPLGCLFVCGLLRLKIVSLSVAPVPYFQHRSGCSYLLVVQVAASSERGLSHLWASRGLRFAGAPWLLFVTSIL